MLRSCLPAHLLHTQPATHTACLSRFSSLSPFLPPARLLQRVNFPSFATQCLPDSSCTSCLCQLSKAMSVAQSDPHDVALCMNNFRCDWRLAAAQCRHVCSWSGVLL